MLDEDKTKEQLITELHELRKRVAESEKDIEERKRAERALLDSNSLLVATLESTADGILVVNTAGKVISFNRTFLELWRIPETLIATRDDGQLLRFVLDQLSHPDTFLEKVRALYQTPEASSIDELAFKDGRIFERYSQPQRIDNTIVGRVWSFRDITERRRAEEKILRAKDDWERTFDAVPDLIAILDNEYRIVKVNKAMAATLGKTPGECVGLTCYQAMHGTSEPPWFCPQRKLLADRTEHTMEVYEEHLGGHFAVSVSPLFDSAGELKGSVHVCRDTTESKQTEEMIRSREHYFRSLIEHGLDIITVLEEDGTIRYESPSVQQVLGYSPQELVGRSGFELIHPEDSPGIIEVFHRGVSHPGTVESVEFRYKHKDGSWRTLEGVGTNLVQDPIVAGIVVNSRDITERKHLEKQLRQTQKMEAIGTLAGGIAHDFNNILGIILGYAEMALMEVQEPSPVHDALQQMLKATDRAKDLVRQILAFSRQNEQARRAIEVRFIVGEAMKLLRASTPATIEIRQDFAIDGTVMADPTEIHQIIMNLCTNANHAMRDNGGILAVSLNSVGPDADPVLHRLRLMPGAYLRLSVSDTGHGIEPSAMDRIFEPYFTTKGSGEGTGLGLAVVHGIVRGLGGAIDVQSQVGKGTVFYVFLPRINEEGRVTKNKSNTELPSGKEHILFVDDEQALVELGRQMLTRLGYQVTTRTSSLEALELFHNKQNRFDLIITDQTMPNMVGTELARELRRLRPDIPIILCTGYSERLTEDRVKELGILQLLMKPVAIDQLATMIREILDGKRK